MAILGVNPDDTSCPTSSASKDSTVALLAVAFLVASWRRSPRSSSSAASSSRALRNWQGLWPAAIITGLVFGAIHVGSAEAAFLLPLGFFGFVLCLLCERTGSLYPCMALHCAQQLARLRGLPALGLADRWCSLVAALALISPVASRSARRWTPAPAPAG